MKPRFLPKFPVFAQDVLSSLRWQMMTAEERGGYMHLLLLEWLEGGLPADPEALLTLGSIHGLPADHPRVVEAFPIGEDGLRHNPKLERVRAEAEGYFDEQARKSALGVAARAQKSRRKNPRVNPKSTPPTPTPTPTPTQTPTQTQEDPPTPRKRGKPPTAAIDPLEVLAEFVSIDRPEVQRALGDYLRGRQERRQKPQTPRGLRLGLRKLEPFGATGAVQAIEEATQGGWLGFFEPRALGHSNGNPRGLDAVRSLLAKGAAQ